MTLGVGNISQPIQATFATHAQVSGLTKWRTRTTLAKPQFFVRYTIRQIFDG